MLRQAGLTLDVRRHGGQAVAASHAWAGVPRMEILLLEVREKVLVVPRVLVGADKSLNDVQALRVLVELRPGWVLEREDHLFIHPQPEAKRIVRPQRREVHSLPVRQPAQQLVLARMAEIDVVVHHRVWPDRDLDVILAQERRRVVVDEDVVDDFDVVCLVSDDPAGIVIQEIVVELQALGLSCVFE